MQPNLQMLPHLQQRTLVMLILPVTTAFTPTPEVSLLFCRESLNEPPKRIMSFTGHKIPIAILLPDFQIKSLTAICLQQHYSLV